MVEIVSATRSSESDFWHGSALGVSLRRLKHDKRIVARVAFANQRGLPEIYNGRISAADAGDILVFIHDDVWIDDYYLADRVVDGLRTFDVIGVAGTRRRFAHQPFWSFVDTSFPWPYRLSRSGFVAHGASPFGRVTRFGAAPAECELLDGVFLAATREVLTTSGVLFDPRFDFHFYDMDFCRSARQHGLRLGTWPICLTHQSGGAFGTEKWEEKHRAYVEKWGD